MIPTSGLGITHPHPFTVLFLVAVFTEADVKKSAAASVNTATKNKTVNGWVWVIPSPDVGIVFIVITSPAFIDSACCAKK